MQVVVDFGRKTVQEHVVHLLGVRFGGQTDQLWHIRTNARALRLNGPTPRSSFRMPSLSSKTFLSSNRLTTLQYSSKVLNNSPIDTMGFSRSSHCAIVSPVHVIRTELGPYLLFEEPLCKHQLQ